MEAFLSNLRKSTTPKTWSKGIEISRVGDIREEHQTEDSIKLRVKEYAKLVSHTVELWPSEDDWHCDCAEVEDPCPHVIAAALAIKKTKENGTSLEKIVSEAVGRIGYRFLRANGFILFKRVYMKDSDKEFPITTPLSVLAQNKHFPNKLVTTKQDLVIDSLIEDKRETNLTHLVLSKIFRQLTSSCDVKFHGEPVTIHAEARGYIGRIEDMGGGVRLFGVQDPSIVEVFRNGVALCKESVLCPVSLHKLSPEELKILASGQVFGQKEMVHLVAEILPQLRKKMPVEVFAKNLPGVVVEPPRLLMKTVRKAETLEVIPSIVYGNPEIAYVQNGNLITLGDEVPIRNLEAERALSAKLYTEFGWHSEDSHQLSTSEAIEFTERVSYRAIEADGDYQWFRTTGQLKPAVEANFVGGDASLSVDFTVEAGGQRRANPERVLQAWREGESLVPLLDGGWARLPKDWLNRYGKKVADILAAKESGNIDNPTMPRSMICDVVDFCHDLGVTVPDDLKQIYQSLQSEHLSTLVAHVPDDVNVSLRSYQKEGVAWLQLLKKNQLGALLADDMGLGKTLQSICILEKKSLVVAPTSVLQNWEKEIQKFRPTLKTLVYHGLKRELLENVDVILTSYAILRLDIEALSKIKWQVVVLDEAQNIKNPDSLASRSAFQLKANFRLNLTGTPIENRLEDLWSQFNFLAPGFLGNRKDFAANYSKPILSGNRAKARDLRNRLKPFVLRRLKTEVAKELPPKTETVLYCEMSPEETKLYEAILAATKKEVLERLGYGEGVFAILEALLRLRQAACHPALIPGESALTSSKLELLLTTLEVCLETQHKVLIFSQWTSFLDIVGNALTKTNINYLRIDGSTQNRMEIVDSFQSDSGPSVLLLSLKAAGVGLNLTAADHVMILDPWWNPAVEDQAADRAYRIGQTKPVLVQRFVAKHTVEEKILQLQQHKRNLSEIALVGDPADTFSDLKLTREDLLSLLA